MLSGHFPDGCLHQTCYESYVCPLLFKQMALLLAHTRTQNLFTFTPNTQVIKCLQHEINSMKSANRFKLFLTKVYERHTLIPSVQLILPL